jgi:hypothetical protein
VHGGRTLKAQQDQSAASLRLQQLEDAMHFLKMTTAKRSRGRKANSYKKINNIEDLNSVFNKI